MTLGHARGNCPFINLGKKPADLTVLDVFGTLEPERYKIILRNEGFLGCALGEVLHCPEEDIYPTL